MSGEKVEEHNLIREVGMKSSLEDLGWVECKFIHRLCCHPKDFIVTDMRGVQKFKMTTYKPEVLISQLADEIETPFQGLPLIFGVE